MIIFEKAKAARKCKMCKVRIPKGRTAVVYKKIEYHTVINRDVMVKSNYCAKCGSYVNQCEIDRYNKQIQLHELIMELLKTPNGEANHVNRPIDFDKPRQTKPVKGMETCTHCNGYGASLKEPDEICTQCGGRGLVKEKKEKNKKA